MNIILIVLWVLCGVLHFGLNFGYFQNGYPGLADEYYWFDWIWSFVFSLLGPIALVAHFFFLYFSIKGWQSLKWK